MTSDSKTWHLADNSEEEFFVTEFEFILWRVFSGFIKWQEDCQAHICGGNKLTGDELAFLHLIRIGDDRPKTIYEIARLLNRDDYNSIRYGIKKLIDLGYVQQLSPSKRKTDKKTCAYKITKSGIENTKMYTMARKKILIDLYKEHSDIISELKNITKSLTTISEIYNEADRRTYWHGYLDEKGCS